MKNIWRVLTIVSKRANYSKNTRRFLLRQVRWPKLNETERWCRWANIVKICRRRALLKERKQGLLQAPQSSVAQTTTSTQVTIPSTIRWPTQSLITSRTPTFSEKWWGSSNPYTRTCPEVEDPSDSFLSLRINVYYHDHSWNIFWRESSFKCFSYSLIWAPLTSRR